MAKKERYVIIRTYFGDRRPQITAPSTANPIKRPGRPRKTALDAPEG